MKDFFNKFKVKIPELCYYIFFAALLFAKGIGLYDGQALFKAILVFAGICWLIKAVFTKYTLKELIIAGLLLVLGVITYIVSGDKGLLLYIMMITGAKNISVKRLFRVGLVTWIISFGGTFILTAVHIVESPFKVHEKLGELIIRWGLGASHPNVLHVSYLLLCMLVVFVLSEKIDFKWLFLLMAGNLYTFLYSVSFTGFAAVSAYLFLCGCWIIRKDIGILENILIKTGVLFCILISMAAPLLLKGKAFDILNKLLNTRLRLSRLFLTEYPFSLFGRKVADIVTYSATMDCSYVYGYVAYGVIAFALLVLGYGMIIHKYCKEKRGTELCIILACLIAGITEPFLFNTSFKNISFVFFAELIYGYNDAEGNSTSLLTTAKKFSVRKKKELAVIFAAGLLIGAVGYSVLEEKPQRIIVPRSESDLDETFYAELDITEEQIREEDVVYGTPKDGTPWMELKGAAVELESIRGMTTSAILTGSILFIAAAVIYDHREMKRS